MEHVADAPADASHVARGSSRVVHRRADLIGAVVGAVILVASGVVANSGRVGSVERRVFAAVNGLTDALAGAMHAAQYLGVLVVGLIVAIAALLARRWRLAIAAATVTLAKLAAERVVWQVVQRSRPGTTIPGAIVRGNTPTSGASFVSGHVVLTTALAWVVTPYLRGWWRVLPGALAALVAFARLYLGAHAPLDVLGGAGLGSLIGALTNLALGVPGVERAGER
jgi:undecaprenyl-diphosphatase